jgi:hypothetical protein
MNNPCVHCGRTTYHRDGCIAFLAEVSRARAIKPARPRFSVSFREEGRGPATRRRFSSLADVQTYVRDRWQGADYIDGPASFHTDYCAFTLTGCTLADLGARRSNDYRADDYWTWDWKELSR